MANIYVRSTDGSDADNGSTWALAKATLAGAAAIDSAGDQINVSQSHAESTASAVSLSWAGSIAAPVKIVCANDASEPPTAVATSGTVETTGNNNLTIVGGGSAFVYGLTFTAGAGASGSAQLILIGISGTGGSRFENCDFIVGTTGIAGTIQSLYYSLDLVNCRVRFGNTTQYIAAGGPFRWSGGSIISGSSAPALLFGCQNGVLLEVENVDLSNADSATDITDFTVGKAIFRNCKLPASWSGALTNSAVAVMGVAHFIEMHNCDSGDTNYRFQRRSRFVSIVSETTLVRTGGANDGGTGLSWKMSTEAGTVYPTYLAETGEIVRWNETIGSAITVTVEILHDPGSPGSLNDDEIWLEVQYLGTSGFPLGSLISDAKADVLATGAAQASSSATWTTTGMSNPTTQKLSVTFTPQEVGFIHAVVKMAKPSYTVYVCPKLDIT